MPKPDIPTDDNQTVQANVAQELDRINLERANLYNLLQVNGDKANALIRNARQAEEAQKQALKDHRQAAEDALRTQIRLNVSHGTKDESVLSQDLAIVTTVAQEAQTALDAAQTALSDVKSQQDVTMASLLQECQDIQSQIADLSIQWQEALLIQEQGQIEIEVDPIPIPIVVPVIDPIIEQNI